MGRRYIVSDVRMPEIVLLWHNVATMVKVLYCCLEGQSRARGLYLPPLAPLTCFCISIENPESSSQEYLYRHQGRRREYRVRHVHYVHHHHTAATIKSKPTYIAFEMCYHERNVVLYQLHVSTCPSNFHRCNNGAECGKWQLIDTVTEVYGNDGGDKRYRGVGVWRWEVEVVTSDIHILESCTINVGFLMIYARNVALFVSQMQGWELVSA